MAVTPFLTVGAPCEGWWALCVSQEKCKLWIDFFFKQSYPKEHLVFFLLFETLNLKI